MSIDQKVLLLGLTGQVGHELTRSLAPFGTVITSGRNCGDQPANLSDPDKVDALLASVHPNVIVNAAAYTNVDGAEDEPELAHRLNCDLPGQLAEYAAETESRLIHYSTDYVFNGVNQRPYRESDQVDPVGVYGISKLAGEESIRSSGCRHLIFRTAWVYANHGSNFVKTILKLAAERDELRIVDDQFGTPTWARMLAQLTVSALERADGLPSATFHLSSTGEPVSWYGFAVEFIEMARNRLPRIPRVVPVSTAEFPTRARRPEYSVLDNGAFQREFGLRVSSWRQQLQWCLEDFAEFPSAKQSEVK